MQRYQSARALDKVQSSQSPTSQKGILKTAFTSGEDETKSILRREASLKSLATSARDRTDENLRNSSSPLNDFDLDQWLKDFFRYALFLVVFTLLIFQGRGSDQIAAYAAMWKSLIENRTLEVRKVCLSQICTFFGFIMGPTTIDQLC
jgi:hypothetical protein